MAKLLTVKIVRAVDTSPDTSYYGSYSVAPESEFSIDRQERGDMGHGEFRYFNPSDNYADEKPKDIRKYVEQDYKRMEALNNQQWHYLGVWAEAEILLTGDTVQKIRSSGLWGIESDSDESYLKEVSADEYEMLKDELRAVGIKTKGVESERE